MKINFIILLISLNLFAKEATPFIHHFGELRVYFKDWLVVCYDNGVGECRMVNYIYRSEKSDKFFGDSVLTIYPKRVKIDFYNKNAPSNILDITIFVDKKEFLFNSNDYITPNSGGNILETYSIKNKNSIKKIIKESKPSRWIIFIYKDIYNNTTKVKFSLMGFTKAVEFIENR